MADTAPVVRRVVEAFLAAMAERDFERAADFVSEEVFEFIGPVKSYTGRQILMRDFDRLYPVLASLDVRRVFLDGDEACVIYNLVTTVPGLEMTRVAAWFTVAGGRITRMETFFDAHAYAQLFDV